MDKKQMPVEVKLVTEIREQEEKAITVIEETGDFIQNGNIAVVRFTEHQEEQADVNALITITQDKVSIKRTGAVDMLQKFKENKRTENVYRHEFGTINMETQTDQINFQQPIDQKPGELFISYTTKLNGEGNRKHRLTLTFKEVSP